jgi:hypothetical protein
MPTTMRPERQPADPDQSLSKLILVPEIQAPLLPTPMSVGPDASPPGWVLQAALVRPVELLEHVLDDVDLRVVANILCQCERRHAGRPRARVRRETHGAR